MNFGRLIYRFRWYVLLAYFVVTAALLVFVPPSNPQDNEGSLLPPNSRYSASLTALQKAFPETAGLSDLIIVFERRDGALSPADLSAVEAVAAAMTKGDAIADAAELAKLRIRSPRSMNIPSLGGEPVPNPLISSAPPGQAAMIIVSIPYSFISARGARIVDHAYGVVRSEPRPAGLAAAITGSGGYGHDYGRAVQRSHRKTLIVTLIAVIVILLVVYRAPIAALVPLISISIAGLVAIKFLSALGPWGLHVGSAEEIFVIVLLYGAGTDYTLLLLSRYREFLDARLPAPAALAGGLNAILPALLASAGTNISGLLMLRFAQFPTFQSTGAAVAIALAIALVASLTLAPALAAVMGSHLFWPRRSGGGLAATAQAGLPLGRHIWPRVALTVTLRPLLILLVTIVVFVPPAWQGLRITWVYDTLASLPRGHDSGVGNATVGLEMVKRHWPVGEIAPVNVLVQADDTMSEPKLRDVSQRLTVALHAVPGVRDVRSLAAPLGKSFEDAKHPLMAVAVHAAGMAEYAGTYHTATRLSVILDQPALTLQAMAIVENVEKTVQSVLAAQHMKARVYLTGSTSQMAETRTITQHDFHLIAVLTLGVIFLIVLVLLRDAILSAFMVASTVLSYLATLGICYWIFVGVLGQAGLDWKVEVFLFVVMVAVGQDYNIFLAARLAQEGAALPPHRAARRAIIFTGPVISSCGLIMAATLGSLAAGELGLLKQLGAAFALGMMIDTFIVRPLMLPAFAVLTRRTGKATGLVG